MSFERKYDGLTKRTRKLLAEGESALVDFKQKAAGLSTEDLVAFANTVSGGDILIGVTESKRGDGSQFGKVVGHSLDDEPVLSIVNKAISCVPPVPIKLYAENLSGNAIIRVRVPPGPNRPYSTPKGIYCVREGSRNRPLQPGELLEIFLHAEGQAFAARFEEAASAVSGKIAELEEALEEKIESIGDQFGWAEYKVGDTQDSIETVLARVSRLQEEVSDSATRLRALFRQDNRADPVRERARADLMEQLKSELKGREDVIEELRKGASVQATVQPTGRAAREFDQADLQALVTEAAKSVLQESDRSTSDQAEGRTGAPDEPTSEA